MFKIISLHSSTGTLVKGDSTSKFAKNPEESLPVISVAKSDEFLTAYLLEVSLEIKEVKYLAKQ